MNRSHQLYILKNKTLLNQKKREATAESIYLASPNVVCCVVTVWQLEVALGDRALTVREKRLLYLF